MKYALAKEISLEQRTLSSYDSWYSVGSVTHDEGTEG